MVLKYWIIRWSLYQCRYFQGLFWTVGKLWLVYHIYYMILISMSEYPLHSIINDIIIPVSMRLSSSFTAEELHNILFPPYLAIHICERARLYLLSLWTLSFLASFLRFFSSLCCYKINLFGKMSNWKWCVNSKKSDDLLTRGFKERSHQTNDIEFCWHLLLPPLLSSFRSFFCTQASCYTFRKVTTGGGSYLSTG